MNVAISDPEGLDITCDLDWDDAPTGEDMTDAVAAAILDTDAGTVYTTLKQLGIARFGAGDWQKLPFGLASEFATYAEEYARAYAGSNDFLLAMRDKAQRKTGLTDNMAAAVLRAMVEDVAREIAKLDRERFADLDADDAYQHHLAREAHQAKLAAEREAALAEQADWQREHEQHLAWLRFRDFGPDVEINVAGLNAVPNATYTVVFGGAESNRVTIRLRPMMINYQPAPSGAREAQYLVGSNNDADYMTFARFEGDRVQMFHRFRQDGKLAHALAVLSNTDADAQNEARLAYALESGRCARCNRTLTVPASIAMGLGPDCAAKGW